MLGLVHKSEHSVIVGARCFNTRRTHFLSLSKHLQRTERRAAEKLMNQRTSSATATEVQQTQTNTQ